MKKTLLLLTIALLGASVPAWGKVGLAARFGEVILEGVEIGRTYNLREKARIPFGIENRGDADTEVHIEFLAPPSKEVVEGYEVIPDPTWLKALPGRMQITAHTIGFFDLLLTIPDDPTLVGKHFQVNIRAQNSPTGLLGVAVENRLRFSIGPGPESLAAEKKRKKMSQLDFDVSPQVLYLKDIPVGKSYDVRNEQKKAIRIANFGQDVLEMQLGSVEWEKRLHMPEGYEPIPNPEWVVFKSSNVKVDGEAIEQTRMIIKIPDEPQYKGKKYAALVKTGLSG